MKIPCVRCGKKIESPHVYCRECSKELEADMDRLAVPKKRRRWPFLLLLLVLACGAIVYFALPGKDVEQKLVSLREEVPAVSEIAKKLPEALTPEALRPPQEPSTPPASARPDQPEQPAESAAGPNEEDTILFTQPEETPSKTPASDLASSEEASISPAPDQEEQAANATAQTEAEISEQADTQEESTTETTASENATAEETTSPDAASEAPSEEQNATAEVAEDGAEQTAAVEATPEDTTPPAAVPATVPATVEDGVWVFWMETEDADKKLVNRLQSHGFVNSVAKGQWPGHFNDKNIFYRHEDKRGLERLRQALETDDYFDYYYNNERIGQNVKRIFNEHDDVMFVIILQ